MSSHRHFKIHKPWGYLSQFISNGVLKQKHHYLGELYDFPEGTMAIGRLDLQSEGLLLLTTDGQFSHEITSRKYEKEYYVQVDGEIDDQALKLLTEGVNISIEGQNYLTLPGQAKRIPDPGFAPRIKKVRDDRHGPSSWISITINEGKFRQVRKMTAAVGYPTLRLVRVRIGDYQLGEMQSGAVEEIEK